MRAERFGFAANGLCVMLMYEVSKDPEIRREVSQLQRCDGNGKDATGTLKVCVAAPQEQDTVSSRDLFRPAISAAI